MQEKKHIFDNPENVQRLLKIFWSCIVLLLIVDFFIEKHPVFEWEKWPAFYAVYGFVACVLLVLVSKYILRPVVKRKENFYE